MSATGAVAALALNALAVLLLLAAAGKLRRPAPIRATLTAAGVPNAAGLAAVLAVGELAAGLAGLLAPGVAGPGAVALVFTVIAVGTTVLLPRAGGAACGCFGEDASAALGRRHVIGAATAAVTAVLAAVAGPPAPLHRPTGALLVTLASGALLGWVLRGLATGGARGLDAAAVRLTTSSAQLLEARLSRRSLLARLALGGSALAVAPLRYLLYPGTALGVIAPSHCAGGKCTDGYTAFCCEINHGLNGCPEGTFAGGWWMCTDYRGHRLCHDAGVRYYVDCNALPGHTFPGGCHCAGGNCDQRRVACNVFRYGQCNTQVEGTTAVVCRMVVCQNPGTIDHLNCSHAVMVDDAVCGHEAACLEPPAVQLPGAGGA